MTGETLLACKILTAADGRFFFLIFDYWCSWKETNEILLCFQKKGIKNENFSVIFWPTLRFLPARNPMTRFLRLFQRWEWNLSEGVTRLLMENSWLSCYKWWSLVRKGIDILMTLKMMTMILMTLKMMTRNENSLTSNWLRDLDNCCIILETSSYW